jgi:hypothetical protein
MTSVEWMEGTGMGMVRLWLGVLGVGFVTLGAAAAQQIELPPGPNRDLVLHECQACHDLGMIVAAAGLSRDGWNATIDEMISYGLRVDSEERAKILDYLSRFLGSPAAPKPAGR